MNELKEALGLIEKCRQKFWTASCFSKDGIYNVVDCEQMAIETEEFLTKMGYTGD